MPQWQLWILFKWICRPKEDRYLSSSFRWLKHFTSTNRLDKYLLVYLVWVLACGLWVLPFLTAPQALAGMLDQLGVSRWAISAFQRFGFVLLGLAWLVATIWTEHYLRTSVSKQRLARSAIRVGIATFGALILLVLLHLAPALIQLV